MSDSPRSLPLIGARYPMWLVGIAICVVYIVAGKAGLSLAVVNASASPVWPPTGIALASVLLFGSRIWPAILLGAFIVNQTTAGAIGTSVAIAAGNTGEALLGACLTNRFASGYAAFTRTQSVFRFVFLAGFLSTIVSATVGVSSLAIAGDLPWTQYGAVWLTWWIGNAAGAILVGPLLILWVTTPLDGYSRAQWLELLALSVVFVVVARVGFVQSLLPVEFLYIPISIWIGVRFGPREVATVTCLLSAMAVWARVVGAGPFADQPPNTALLLTQLFIVIAQVVGIAIGTTVMERMQAEKRLHEFNEELERRVTRRTAELVASEARLEEAQEVAHIGSWEWDAARQQLWCSDEMYRMWRVDRELLQPSYAAFLASVHPDDRSRVHDTIKRALAHEEPFEFEFRLALPGDNVRNILTKGRAVRNEADGTVRMLGTGQDVTEQKQLEGQVRQSQKLEAVGLLAAGIAHDFNNLITAMGGYTELVVATFEEGDARRADLMEVRKAIDRATGLTRRLLAFSRRQSLQSQVVDLNGLVSSIQSLLRRTIGEHIDLQLDLDPELEAIRADPGQLEQVLLNLAVNARDAMPGGGQLHFETSMVDIDDGWARQHPPMLPGRYVRLTVSDNGTGMSPETQARIFEPFFTTKPAGQGTGFGLATTYGIIKQSGGFIWVNSQLGRGTVFHIYLPFVREAVETNEPAQPKVLARHGSETILVVEDDAAVRRLSHTVLRGSGYTVLEARDGEDALEVVLKHRSIVHLLITDVVMPGLTGADLAERLQKTYPDIRVLYTSGYSHNALISVDIDSSAPFLPKPFLPIDLLAKVEEVLTTGAVPKLEP